MGSTTEIPNSFIDNFSSYGNPSFILVYIALLRICESGRCTTGQIADFLEILETDAKRAVAFWVKKGLIRLVEESEDGALKIEFLNIDGECSSQNNTELDICAEETAAPAEKLPTAPKGAIAERCPAYSAKEIDIYLQNNAELKKLFKDCEGYLGKLLTYNDMSALFGFHDWLRLPIEVIDLLVSYCASNDHRAMRYIEKVAVLWADAGINTKEKASARIKLFNSDFRAIMKELGKAHREPVKKEEEYMIKWLKTYKMPLEVVLEACTKTVMQTARPTFKYADSIIEKWHTAGIESLPQVEAAEKDFLLAKASQKEGASVKKTKKTGFSNFTERDDIDFAERRRFEMERLHKVSEQASDK